MAKRILMEDLEPVIREVLESGSTFKFKPRGVSMLPLIRESLDAVILSKPPLRLKKYDIILFKRSDRTYVMHRVIKVRKDDYVICGDHQQIFESGITDDMIIAVVSKIDRGGIIIDCNEDKKYRLYCHATVFKKELKHICLGLRHICIIIIKKFKIEK